MNKVCVIIPALNPARELIDYIYDLLDRNVSQVVVVNDGSISSCIPVFHQIARIQNCTVLTHEQNKGKGRALKTAFEYVMNHCNVHGVITADADGQHSVQDVVKIAKKLMDHQDSILLGVRDFGQNNVPARSYIGNKITSFLFKSLFKIDLQDTQSGLRGIPINLLPSLLTLEGERYEYEMNMLIVAAKRNIPIKQIPIQTIYINKNESSYYQPIRDSLKIFSMIVSRSIAYKRLNEGEKHGI
ncbi:glycosyltransferase family 2 protein [Ureibacillus sp. FSL K6-8385]|uniref:Glycosyltransferase family 2 protein n=1 Tax=Ureibacillus terrenus TaxID=118246 RepID=A0A540V0T3_9BACL|nr:glycosyltransferase family 2 protein [Ureibacillus terrenus]MED3662197.1 glycosyltransferase family 2 protein [Ureibacillus terrenus]MED3765147.1 glycosyltransferase family 2 protein [Ureibacillus terrenus]TQE90359.1 glycosyltransferase family 2 protein [Ureibacillus terrenus]